MEADEKGIKSIAARSRGTPRIANRLLRRARDFAEIKGQGILTGDIAGSALDMLEVDEQGFDPLDRKFLHTILNNYDGAGR